MRIALLLLLLSATAQAAPPPNADPVLHEWFEHQYSIGKSFCCNEADGHILNETEWRTNGKGYDVNINGKWYAIPPEAMVDVRRGGPNPTGHAVVWYKIKGDDDVTIFCFAQGFEG